MASSYSIDEQVITCGKRLISFLRKGKGPPLILLHGIGSSAASWQAQLDGLSDHYDVIAWNAPGYSQSTPLEDAAPATVAYADALAQLLEQLNIDKCFLAGHSLGSLIAASFVRMHSHRTIAVTLASCALGHGTFPSGERQRLLDSRLTDVRELGMLGMAEKRGPRLLTSDAPEEMVRTVISNMAQAHPGGYAQAARMLSSGDMLADLAQTDPALPIQVVYGQQDVITPPRANQRAAQARKGISSVAIPAAGHLVYVEQAAAFNTAVLAFNILHGGVFNQERTSHG